jgi:hypothetical protein
MTNASIWKIRRVAGLHVDDGQLVVEGLALVVGVEDVDRGDRSGEILPEEGIENVDQQVAMVVGPEQGLEDAVDLGIDGAVHTKSVFPGRGVDKELAEPGAGSMRDRARCRKGLHSGPIDGFGPGHPRSAFTGTSRSHAVGGAQNLIVSPPARHLITKPGPTVPALFMTPKPLSVPGYDISIVARCPLSIFKTGLCH